MPAPPSLRRARTTLIAGGGVVLAMLVGGLVLARPVPARASRAVAPVVAPRVAPAAVGVSTGSTTGVGPTSGVRSTPRKPNIVVVMLDDMRWDEMRFAPNARRYIRARGLDFRNSFSPYPLCCPARASFLTGKYAHNHHVLYHEAPYGFGSLDDHLTIGGRMQAAGYQTALVGKYLNRYGIQPSKVTGRSSQHYVPAGWTDWMVGLDASPLGGGTYDYFDFTQNVNGRTVPHRGQYSSTVIADETRGLIRKYHRSGKPFFLWVTPVAPHHGGPVEPDDPATYYGANGWRQTFETPARPDWVKGRFDKEITHAFGQPAKGPSEADVRDKPKFVRRNPEATATEKLRMRDMERQRAESIYAWDVEFGRIIAQLKRSREYDDTVLVFTSDNGYYLGEHRQRLGKIKDHEPVLRVPLVVAGPGIRSGVRYSPITTMDLTATVLDLAGARALPRMDGASRVPEMTGGDRPWTTPVLTEALLTGMRARKASDVPGKLSASGLRTGRYKLTRYANLENELYDLLVDPNELRNVWDDPAYAAVRREMLAVWERQKACRAAACRTPLPANLQMPPAALAKQYVAEVDAKHAYYGD